MILKLVIRSIRYDRTRIMSAILGVAAAVGLLTWHVGLTYTAIHSGDEAARSAAAPFCAWICGADEGRGEEVGAKGAERATAEATMGRRMGGRRTKVLPQRLIKAIEERSEIERAEWFAPLGVTIDIRPGGRVIQGPPFRGNLVRMPEGGIPFDVGEIEGRLPDHDSREAEVVVSETLFGGRVPKPEVGSEMPLELVSGTARVKIVGFYRMSTLVQVFPTMYGNSKAIEDVRKATPGYEEKPTLVLLKMREGGEAAAILGEMLDATPQAERCKLYTVGALSERFRSDSIKNLLSSMPMTLILSLLTASSLLASILMIGVTLQRRRIAELRCAGMTRGGVVWLLVVEAMVELFSGWVIGVSSAVLLLQVFLWSEKGSGELPGVIWVGWQMPFWGAVFALAIGFCAILLPMVSAMRVRPLEITGIEVTDVRPISFWRVIAAVLLLLPMPILSVDFTMAEKTKALLMGGIGFPAFIAALIVGIHPLMKLTERIFLRPLGWLLRLDGRILQRRISRDPGRVIGTILSLALGLGGYVAIHIWGGTLMSSFVPSAEWPDAIVSALPNGISPEEVAEVRGCKGIANGKVLTIDCTQKAFERESPAFKGREGEIPKGRVLLFGVDAEEAFGGENPLMRLRFEEGERKSAIAAMKSGKGCVIVSMLARMGKLHKGDRIRFAGRELEIAGIVDLNWHMVTSRGLVRTQFGKEARQKRGGEGGSGGGGRTIGMAFVAESLVREITGNEDTSYFLWLNMIPELRAMGGLKSTIRLDDEIRAVVKSDGVNAIRVHHRDEIADGTMAHGNDILGTMARIPFWSLVVTSTGIAVLLIAAVRGGKKEFAMMRAVGMTRSQLLRLLFGEALLVTLSALVLSLLVGILVGWSFTGLSRWMMDAGLAVKLIIPWGTIGKGFVFALGLCVLMAAVPLLLMARRGGETGAERAGTKERSE